MSTRTRSLALLFLSLCLFLAVPEHGFGQVDRGGIVGLVTDQAGARVSGAQVKITNLAANQSSEVATDENGHYAADLLRIGSYSVTVEKAGFKKAVQPSVEVGVNQTARVDFNLQVGSASETIEVDGGRPVTADGSLVSARSRPSVAFPNFPSTAEILFSSRISVPARTGARRGRMSAGRCSKMSVRMKLSRSMDFAWRTITSF